MDHSTPDNGTPGTSSDSQQEPSTHNATSLFGSGADPQPTHTMVRAAETLDRLKGMVRDFEGHTNSATSMPLENDLRIHADDSTDPRPIPTINREPLISSRTIRYSDAPVKAFPDDIERLLQTHGEVVDRLIDLHYSLLDPSSDTPGSGYSSEPSEQQLWTMKESQNVFQNIGSTLGMLSSRYIADNRATVIGNDANNLLKRMKERLCETVNRFNTAVEPFIHHHHQWTTQKFGDCVQSIKRLDEQSLPVIDGLLQASSPASSRRRATVFCNDVDSWISDARKCFSFMTSTARCTRDLSDPCVTLALELNQMIENVRPRVVHRKRLIERLLEFDPESCLAESRRELTQGSATRDPFDEPEGAHPSLLLSHDIGRYAAMMENVTRRFQSLYEIEGRSKAVTGPSGERPSELALKTIQEGLDMLDRICEASAAHRRLLQLELSSLTCDPTDPSLTTLIKEVYTRTAHEGETRQSFVDLVRPYSEDKLPWSTCLIEEATASTRDYRDRLSALNAKTFAWHPCNGKRPSRRPRRGARKTVEHGRGNQRLTECNGQYETRQREGASSL
ncbi:hypothetical protein I317_03389 [Kwoniella heveanensis CBS 569]|nr:hypothetical protein I317_03389 [Kwoniella heveanensis CBS 569]